MLEFVPPLETLTVESVRTLKVKGHNLKEFLKQHGTVLEGGMVGRSGYEDRSLLEVVASGYSRK